LCQSCCRIALEPGRCSVEKCSSGRKPVCCAGEEWVCLASDEQCHETPKCLDLFPGTCPISLTALVVFVVGTASCVMVLIIFFTRARHEEDNIHRETDEDEADEDHPLTDSTRDDIKLTKRNGKDSNTNGEGADVGEIQDFM